jgi:Flp pilus assembly protein TadG
MTRHPGHDRRRPPARHRSHGPYAPCTAHDGGSIAVEMALAVPLLVVLLLVLIGAFHLGRGILDVNTAAAAGARAASLARTTSTARTAAADAATADLAGRCAHLGVDVDTSAFHRGGSVTVTVACAVSLRSMTGFALPAMATLQGSSTSPLDLYRGTGP